MLKSALGLIVLFVAHLSGQQPPPVFLAVGTTVAPSGTVSLYANNDQVDVERFNAG